MSTIETNYSLHVKVTKVYIAVLIPKSVKICKEERMNKGINNPRFC